MTTMKDVVSRAVREALAPLEARANAVAADMLRNRAQASAKPGTVEDRTRLPKTSRAATFDEIYGEPS